MNEATGLPQIPGLPGNPGQRDYLKLMTGTLGALAEALQAASENTATLLQNVTTVHEHTAGILKALRAVQEQIATPDPDDSDEAEA